MTCQQAWHLLQPGVKILFKKTQGPVSGSAAQGQDPKPSPAAEICLMRKDVIAGLPLSSPIVTGPRDKHTLVEEIVFHDNLHPWQALWFDVQNGTSAPSSPRPQSVGFMSGRTSKQ